jgi:hypothetical protein
MSSLAIKASLLLEHLIFMGRNSRWPNKANHGARPCSSVMRRMRREAYYHRPRAEGNAGVDIGTDDDELRASGDDEEQGETIAATDQAGTAQGAGQGTAQGTGQGGKDAGKDSKTPANQKAGGKDGGKGDSGKQDSAKAKGK